MSGSGFRGRGFGPRGARSKGPTNNFNGPRFPRPNFSHSRHRLSGPEKWVEGPSFPPWQQNKNYGPRSHYRGNLQFRPNGRGRPAGGRGIVRFCGPGRPPAPQFCTNFIRNLGPRPLLQEEHVIEEDKSTLSSQIPLLGSEEERQQKITETADKLKQKLSSITEEDLTNFWEDDVSVLPNNEEDDNRSKIIPELRHEPPELDLTFTDFRDIGRVGCNNLKLDNVEDTPNDDTLVAFGNEITNAHMDENEITILNENTEDCMNILCSVQDNNIFDNVCENNSIFNQSDILLDTENCQQETFHEMSSAECNLENLHLQCHDLIKSPVPLNSDIEENLITNFEENITDLTSVQPITGVLSEKSLVDLNDVGATSASVSNLNDQDVSQIKFSEAQEVSQVHFLKDQKASRIDILEDQNVLPVDCLKDQNVSQADSSEDQNVSQVHVSEDQNVSQVEFSEDQNVSQVELSEDQNVSQVEFTNDQNVSQVELLEDQNVSQLEMQDTNTETVREANLDIHQNDEIEADSHQIQDDLQTNVSQEEVSQPSVDVSDSSKNNSFHPVSDEGVQTNVCDSISPMCSNYNEVHRLNSDTSINAPPHFQPRGFNAPPRFAPRIPGPRCPRWTYQQNGNVFFRGSQRVPFHGNRIPPPRHVGPFTSPDLVTVPFDPRAPPPFPHNMSTSSLDTQHHTSAQFSSTDLPPSFDPSEPPPNMRPASITEASNKQEITQTMASSEPRNQARNALPSNVEILQPPPAFDPREPPPKISSVIINTNESLPDFNPQQPPPKIHKRDETLQPPPIFDPRLSSQERSKLIAPLSTSGPHMLGINLTEPSQLPSFGIAPVAPNFTQPPPINMSTHQAFIPNLQVNYQPVLPQTNTGQLMVTEFALPPPPLNITSVPPPLSQGLSAAKDLIQNHNVSMDDDGLEDMQEAMEFAKQIMNMTEEMKNNQSVSPELHKVSPTPLGIPAPYEETLSLVLGDETNIDIVKKQKKKENKIKRNRQNIVCRPEFEKQGENEIIDDEQNVQNEDKSSEDTLLTGDQMRPKVVFNLNSKIKVLQKPEEWHRSSVHVSEPKETVQQVALSNSHKERAQSKRLLCESRRSNTTQNKKQQRERNSKTNSTGFVEITKTSVLEKSNDASQHQNYIRDSERLPPHSSNDTIQKKQRSKKEIKKVEALTPESSWKNRVISRFLKMSKNDICNMVNNSSLRKFDIAMKHLVKERRPSLSLEMRNSEDEKMKEYDREEFMNQLNAMLDSGAVVGITDLPTEFIHHLSEVLQLEPMPFDLETSERESMDINETRSKDQTATSKLRPVKCDKDEVKDLQSFPEFSRCENPPIEHVEYKHSHKEEPVSHRLNAELNLNVLKEDTNSSKRSSINKPNPEIENTYKKQQPLFNEADLDDILLQVTERTRHPRNANLIRDKPMDIHKGSSLTRAVTEVFECNVFPQIPTKTAADLDDIFSAGIARAKSLNKSANLGNSRTRKSSSEDRSTLKSERYERWNRKEREEPDTFRNLTKEEWEAKYGSIRKTASTSAENLNRDNRNYHSQRYCSSDSPMRNLSMSPVTREVPVHSLERCISRYGELDESQRIGQSESSSDISTSSSTDSDEETVSPNVTKLLKVIKEKEKIAKKKSLNETIRDEVTAEIEKKWKEKSKHKERKSRKREKRKRDRREKRKKEKRKKRKRNSQSNTSKSSEQSEGFRLLTEDEIKKEVVVKEEPVSANEENLSFNDGANNNHVLPISTSKPSEPSPRIESQSSQTERQVPAAACDKALSQAKGKPTIVSMTVQPKTKAQLKQMPEPNDLGQKQIVEKSVEVVKSSVSSTVNTNNEKLKSAAEKCKDSQVEESNKERTNTTLSVSNSLLQTNTSTDDTSSRTGACTNTLLPLISVSANDSVPQISVSANNPASPTVADTNSSPSQINIPANNASPQISVPMNSMEPSPTEVTASNTADTTLIESNVTNNVSVTAASPQPVIQKTTAVSSTESKSGYRKIDIKAYKERALQKRLKEEAKLKETSAANSSVLSQEPQPALPINKAVDETEKSHTAKESDVDASKAEIKDPRLAKNRAARISSWEDSKKEARGKSNERKHKHTDIMQKNKEYSVSVTSENTSELLEFRCKDKSTHKTDSDSSSKDSVKSKDHKNEPKSVTQEQMLKEEEVRVKAGYKIESEEKVSKTLVVAVESIKFKNIRSEGGKELKLKKERTKKSTEKRKKSPRSPSLLTEKHSRPVHEKAIEGTEMPLTVNISTPIQTDIEKTSSCSADESNQSEQTKESLNESTVSLEDTATEHSFNNELNEEQVNIQLMPEESNEQVLDDNEKVKLTEDQQITDQAVLETLNNQQEAEPEKTNIECDQSLLASTEEVTETEENSSKSPEINTTLSESISTGELNVQENNTKKEATISEQTSSLFAKETVTEDKSEDITVSSTADFHRDDRESGSLEDVCLRDKNITNVETVNNSTPPTKMNPEAVNGNANSDSKENAEESEIRSPDSSGSPFKGFLAESIEDEIRQVSQLINIEIITESVEDNETEKSEKLPNLCFSDKLNVEAVHAGKGDEDPFVELKETGEVPSTSILTEEQKGNTENDINKTVIDNSEFIGNVECDAKAEETEDKNVIEESQACKSDITQENISSVINLDSQDTFDEDGEPFIVLDEYRDDTDGKSIEKLSTLDLDLEDCIARDAEIFSSEPSQEVVGSTGNTQSPIFNEMQFSELTEMFDKDNVTSTEEKATDLNAVNDVPAADVVTYEENDMNTVPPELNTKPEIIEQVESVAVLPEIPIESSQNDLPFVEDITQELAAPQESSPDTEKTEPRVLPLENSPELPEAICSTMQTDSGVPTKTGATESSENLSSVTAAVSKSVENLCPVAAATPEPLENLCSVTAATSESLENLSSVTTAMSEPKAEFLESNKKTDDFERENNTEANESLEDKLSLSSSKERKSPDKEIHSNATVEHKSEESTELAKKEQKIPSKSSQKENDEALHRVKSKSKMKHKQHKKRSISKKLVGEAIQSDTVKIKYPNTKEGIMARMIEIDVEIHKLMTEKMTLYQMLTSNALPVDNNFQGNDTLHENEEIETPVVRPRTPSALMSQLIQNIEASPVTNQCAKTSTESLSLKESATNPVQANKSKVSKHEHHTEKKTSCSAARSSDYEERITEHAADIKSQSPRKHKRPKWAIKWKETPETIDNASSTVMEEKRSNDGTKSILKKINAKQRITEEDSNQISINDAKVLKSSAEIPVQTDKEKFAFANKVEASSSRTDEKTVEVTESQIHSNKSDTSKTSKKDDEKILGKDNERDEGTIGALNDTGTAVSPSIKSSDNKTSERSSIYSDDSTWDSVLQNSSTDEQKKPATGLALLEETYRKEIARTRRRTESRKRKKKIRSSLEEELPLSARYGKRRSYHKKKFHNSLDQQIETTKDDPQHWTNIDEVINAVAENRTEDLYTKRPEEQPSNGDNQTAVPDPDSASLNKEHLSNQGNEPETNPEPVSLEEDRRTVVSSVLQDIEEDRVDPPVDSKGTPISDANDTCNNSQLTSSCPSKCQNLLSDEHSQRDTLRESEPQNLQDLPEPATNVEDGITGDFIQVAESNDAGIDPLASAENSESCTIEKSIVDARNENILNVPETDIGSEKIAEETDMQSREHNLQEEAVNREKNVPADVEKVVTRPSSIEENSDNLNEINNDNVATTSEITTCTLNENSKTETENGNEEVREDTSSKLEAQCEKDNVHDTSEQLSDIQEESLLHIREHKGSQKRRESERSNKSSNEENCSNSTSASSTSGSIETLKVDETLRKKMPKRKRGSSRTPLRRSSRYTEEIAKRIKVELDVSAQGVEQEPQEKRVQMHFPNVAPALLVYNEEAENTPTNTKKNRSVHKAGSRKRCMPQDVEVLSSQSASNYESLKNIIKRCKHTVPAIMNCEVRLVDSKHTILKPNVDPSILRKYGISTINAHVRSNSVQMNNSSLSSAQSTSVKDSPSACTKQTKSVKKLDDMTRPSSDQVNCSKVKKVSKFAKTNLSTSSREKCTNPDVKVMPILTREQVVVDISQDGEKPDIEIVEEKMIVTKNQQQNDSGSTLTVIETKDDKELSRTQYTVHKGPILDIKVFENSFLAASEDGRIYRYSQASNGILNIYKGHQAAVTCLYVYNTNSADINKEWLFSGSLDGTLRCYNITTGVQVRDTADIGSPVQCMDEAWGIIFIGTKSGHVLRYHMKSGVIKGSSIQFSDKSVLALKATNEGPRKVLIVASRSQPITIRDAQNGLFLRTICGQKSHTVYSLMRDHSLIYCGTSSTSILVFDFTNGEQMMQYDAGVGIVCMRLYKQLLFAGCYDGNIYVFDTKDCRLVCSIPGPGNMLLSMEVIDNKIIAGSKDKRLQSWQMPRQVRSLL